MPDLTLDQVRETGRFASRLTMHGTFKFDTGAVYYESVVVNDVGLPTPYPIAAPVDGWHHLPGCDCPYCKET